MQKLFDKEQSYIVKGLAIILLLLYHLFENAELVESLQVDHSPFPLKGFLTVTSFGNICVAVFVFLTAYGISTGLFQNGEITLKTAYKQAAKRFGRLVLQFFILFLSVNILWGFKFNYDGLYGMNKQGFLYILTDAAGFAQFFETPTMNMTWWYMKVAYLLIFLVPLLAFAVKKIGYSLLIGAFLLPFAVEMDTDLQRYFFVAAFGVCAASGKWPERLFAWKLPWAGKALLSVAAIIICILVRQNYVVYQTYVAYVEAPIVLIVIYFACEVLGRIPYMGKALGFVGRHSMNMYLVHTFFYMSLWREFIYSFRYAGLIFLALFVTTLLYSVVLELVKKFIKILYNKVRTVVIR